LEEDIGSLDDLTDSFGFFDEGNFLFSFEIEFQSVKVLFIIISDEYDSFSECVKVDVQFKKTIMTVEFLVH